MAMYATPTELAEYLQKDLDTSTAVQSLTLASEEFSSAADTWFTAQAATYTTTGTRASNIWLPYKPIIAVTAVRINGVVITGWTRINQRLFRYAGFGSWYSYVPDLLEVDLTYGYVTVPDDVKLAVLEMAAGSYENPSAAVSESIDDYTIKYDPKMKMAAGLSWRELADRYRGTFIA